MRSPSKVPLLQISTPLREPKINKRAPLGAHSSKYGMFHEYRSSRPRVFCKNDVSKGHKSK